MQKARELVGAMWEKRATETSWWRSGRCSCLGKKRDTLGAFDFPVPASDTPVAPRKRIEREKRGMGNARSGSGSGVGEGAELGCGGGR